MDFFRKLLFLFKGKDRWILILLAAAMLAGAALETLGVGLMASFIKVVSDTGLPTVPSSLAFLNDFITGLPKETFLLYCAVFLAIFYVVKNAFLALITWFQNSFLLSRQIPIYRKLLGLYLSQPYAFHLRNNSARLQQTLSSIGSAFSGIVLPFVSVLSETFVALFILALLFYSKPTVAIASFAVLGTITFAFYRLVRSKLKHYGDVTVHHNTETIKWLNQTLGGVKETLVLGREPFFVDKVIQHIHGSAVGSTYTSTVGQLPRLFIETVAMLGIAMAVYIMLQSHESTEQIPATLGLLALALFRLMPSLTRIVSNISTIRFYKPTLDAVFNDLKGLSGIDLKPALKAQPLPLIKTIEISDLSFSYAESVKPALNHVSMTIEKGSSVAFVGASGAGKTTIVDILLGLLSPTSGAVRIDGKDLQTNVKGWQRNIGYIPQTIYLADDSIRNNVAFGVPEPLIDDAAVWRALQAAQLEEYVRALPKGLDSFAGERGVRMSGGQRQRIGIARALYHNPEVLVLDEATAALDTETEKALVQAIDSLSGQKTIIIIAHRLTTVRNCKKIYKLEEGRLTASGSFTEVC